MSVVSDVNDPKNMGEKPTEEITSKTEANPFVGNQYLLDRGINGKVAYNFISDSMLVTQATDSEGTESAPQTSDYKFNVNEYTNEKEVLIKLKNGKYSKLGSLADGDIFIVMNGGRLRWQNRPAEIDSTPFTNPTQYLDNNFIKEISGSYTGAATVGTNIMGHTILLREDGTGTYYSPDRLMQLYWNYNKATHKVGIKYEDGGLIYLDYFQTHGGYFLEEKYTTSMKGGSFDMEKPYTYTRTFIKGFGE